MAKDSAKRNGHGDDHGAAQIAEERPLQQKISTMPATMLCSTVCVVMDQIAAVVDALDAARRAAGCRCC
jgi:hypothetical protein